MLAVVSEAVAQRYLQRDRKREKQNQKSGSHEKFKLRLSETCQREAKTTVSALLRIGDSIAVEERGEKAFPGEDVGDQQFELV